MKNYDLAINILLENESELTTHQTDYLKKTLADQLTLTIKSFAAITDMRIIITERKEFLSVHGCWQDNAVHTYTNSVTIGSTGDYTEHQGYEIEDIAAINALDVNGLYNCPTGNHYIIRTK